MTNRKTVFAAWIDDICAELEGIQDAVRDARSCIESTEDSEGAREEVRKHIADLRAEWMDYSDNLNRHLSR